jgi:hypothetical protein
MKASGRVRDIDVLSNMIVTSKAGSGSAIATSTEKIERLVNGIGRAG